MSDVVYLPGFTLTVPGDPLPKGRPRAKAGQQPFTPKRTRDAEKALAAAFRSKYPDWEPLAGRLRIEAVFHRRTRRHADTDNLLKLATDALNGVAWVDDEQLEDTRAVRKYGAGDDARTVLVVSRIEEDRNTQPEGEER